VDLAKVNFVLRRSGAGQGETKSIFMKSEYSNTNALFSNLDPSHEGSDLLQSLSLDEGGF
jgi:hypothetical protein